MYIYNIMKLPKLATITQSLKKILKYLFIILLAINVVMYIFLFLTIKSQGNIYDRHKATLEDLRMLYSILYHIIIPGIIETISFVYNRRIMGRRNYK